MAHLSSIDRHNRETERRKYSLFPLGRVRMTLGALAKIPVEDVRKAVTRHAKGDWGDVGTDDWQENEYGLRGLRLYSVYHDANGTKFCIITEADRSQTTVLLPEDCSDVRSARSATPPAEVPAWSDLLGDD